MPRETAIGQRGRLVILILYLAGLLIASWAALGSPIPPVSERGIWFYSALGALLLGNLLVTPFFTKPADAIAYGVTALVAMLAANVWGSTSITGFDKFTWSVAVLYVVLVLAAALSGIAMKDSSRPFWQKVARSCFILADALGSPRAIFSVVFFFALITYHRSVPREYIIIALAWAVFVGLRPLEGLAALARRWRAIWSIKEGMARFGEIVGHEVPDIILVREGAASSANLGDLLLARTDRGGAGIAVALDHVGFADGRWLRAYHLAHPEAASEAASEAGLVHAIADGEVFMLGDGKDNTPPGRDAADARARLLGFVAPDTTVGQLQVELIRSDLPLRQGCLVQVPVSNKNVLYQVIEGITKEEIIQQKNTRGFVRAKAKKVGSWNAGVRSFDPVPWLPGPNQPVLLVSEQGCPVAKEAIGHFPGTEYPVRIDPHLLVTHNAAILGILGVGKSFLALELVERMIDAGIKVICLDLTTQYSTELSAFMDDSADQQIEELIAVGPGGKDNVQQNKEEGGSVQEFTAKAREQLEAFLDQDDPRMLQLMNPVQFEVWRQTTNPYQGQAAMASLTPTEVTRIITEMALDILQKQGVTDTARACIVYEEAHSLIPEWNAVASEGDKTATNGTAKAILQGRKFGLGCLVVTQRTANVTKSILNQCNTVFGLRVYDATGMEFLRNYFGEDFSGVLSTLEDRHAVVFGRASSCRDPVLIRLNDRSDFIRVYREPAPTANEGGEVA